MNYKIDYVCISDIGRCRSENQDNYFCGGQTRSLEQAQSQTLSVPVTGQIDSRAPALIAVFDGMGGEQCGDVAAMLAAESAKNAKFTGDAQETLLDVCHDANDKICRFVDDHCLACMGTTAAIAAFEENGITICNIGDSRIYLLSDGNITRISKDHVVDMPHVVKAPLSQNLGIPDDVMTIEPYIATGVYEDGDRYLLCTDGLTDMLTDEEICEISRKNSLTEAAQKMMDTALERGGRDNITIILCEIREENRNLLQTFLKKMTA